MAHFLRMVLMKIKGENIVISCHLEAYCSYQLSFLKCVNQRPELYSPDFLKKALYRYEVFWLPLAAEADPKPLVAPLDIEWVWHCHMLSPLAYVEDCKLIVGKPINHGLHSESTREKFLKKSFSAWTKRYPNDPFEITSDSHLEMSPDFVSQISYDIIAAAQRQKSFFYQVSLPHFNDAHFLKKALSRYKMYLTLKKKNPGTFLVPCYDIDLMWHSHQLDPKYYAKDTIAIFQRIFNHDDSVNDRSENSKLSQSNAKTRVLWKNTFNENFAMPGAMYRGDPPDGKLYKITPENLFRINYKTSKIVVEKVTVENIPADMKKFRISMKLVQGSNPVAVKKLSGPSLEWKGKALLKSDVTTIKTCTLDVSLFNKVGVACCGNTIDLGKCSFDLQSDIHFANESQTFCKSFAFNDSTQSSVKVTGQFTKPVIAGCKFVVKIQLYEQCTMPLHIEEMWGPVPLPQKAPVAEKSCCVAEHL